MHFQKQGIHTLLLSLSPNWEEFWILATKRKLYLLIEEAHPQNYFHKKTVLECRSVSAGRSALCTAAAASCLGGQIRSAESIHNLHTACKERQRVMDRDRMAWKTPLGKSKAYFQKISHSKQPFLLFKKVTLHAALLRSRTIRHPATSSNSNPCKQHTVKLNKVIHAICTSTASWFKIREMSVIQ